jgi:heme exporter protein D
MERQREYVEMESAAALEQLPLVFVWLESFEARRRRLRERAEEEARRRQMQSPPFFTESCSVSYSQ